MTCFELDPVQGWCTYTLSDDEFFIDDEHLYQGKNWEQFNQSTLRLPPDSYAKLKAYILKMCKKNKGCARDMGKWEMKFKDIEKGFMPQKQIVN